MKTAIIILTLCITSLASARLGESPAQCVERYGKPESVLKEQQQLVFIKNGIGVIACFWNDKVAALIFQKAQYDALNNAVEMSDAEIQALLKANCGGSDFKKTNVISTASYWKTVDGKIMAELDPISNQLTISTMEYMDHRKALSDEADKENLSDF